MKPANFDGLARAYQALEYLTFGHDLERARFALLDRLADCRSILVLGEGDGRSLERLVRIAPEARMHCIDASDTMLAKAQARVAAVGAEQRVDFQCADALSLILPTAAYDAVVTLFFLDCFTPDQIDQLVGGIMRALKPEAYWLFSDFAIPARGLSRARARVWLAVLYAFFRWRTGLAVRSLPPSEETIERAGFRAEKTLELQHGMLRTVWFRRQALAQT